MVYLYSAGMHPFRPAVQTLWFGSFFLWTCHLPCHPNHPMPHPSSLMSLLVSPPFKNTPTKEIADAQSHLCWDFAKVESMVIEWKGGESRLWSLWGANGLDCLVLAGGAKLGQCESQGVISKVGLFRGSSQWHISTLSKCWFVHTNIWRTLNEQTKGNSQWM